MSIQRVHLANATSRDATVLAVSIPSEPTPVSGKGGEPVTFRRYVTAGEGLLDGELQTRFGGTYDQHLVEGDPEVDFETVGRFVEATQSVLIDSNGSPLFCAPEVVEVTYSPTGDEVDRRSPVDVLATINDSVPVRWTGRLIPKADMARKFLVRRSLQLRHVDGVTYDFLHGMATDLAKKESVVLLGSGEDGKGPLVFQINGTPYRGFLEGRVDGERYQLFLHLSNMELKRPATVEATTETGAAS